MTSPRFSMGRTLATPGALAAMQESGDDPHIYFARHECGDWGDLDAHDQALNEESLKVRNGRIVSSYRLTNGTKIWIITEHDRSITTILLPEEY